jgi:hypothetical protein
LPLYQERYAENTSGIIAAITACIAAAGGTVVSYPSNTAGIIQALLDLRTAISGAGPASDVSALIPVTAGEVLAVGDAVYMAANGKVYKARNTGTREQANVLGLARDAAAADASVVVVCRGKIDGLSGLTVGSEYFLGINGTYSLTPPVGGGSYLAMVGQAISATKLDVQPQSPVLLT